MPKVAYLCTDLLFTSKIRETARAYDLELAVARDPEALARVAADAALVIVDLRLPTALAAVERVRAATPRPVVGFCEHERVELMDEARRAGCSQVYAKGKFSTELPRILAQAATS